LRLAYGKQIRIVLISERIIGWLSKLDYQIASSFRPSG
jgi:hypothetical protein